VTISDNLSRIRAVSFDGDMTLWDFEKVMRNSLAHALVELRKHLHQSQCVDLTVDRMIEIRNTVADEFAGKRVTLERVRLEAFRRTIATLGSDDDRLAAHLNSIYLEHRFADIELYPDVLPALDSIAGRYVLGLISTATAILSAAGCRAASPLWSLRKMSVSKNPARRFLNTRAATLAALQSS